MTAYHALCDEFYVSLRIHTKLELHPSRESLLHFFESVGRVYPTLTRMRRRDDGAVVCEEPDDRGSKRWVRVDSNSLRVGLSGAVELAEFARFGKQVLDMASAALTFSPLDYDNFEVVFGFELEYQGNHDELIAQALLGQSPVHRLFEGERVQPIDSQPFLGASLTPDCDLQAYVEVKSRTSTFEVRTQDFERSNISVYLTLRKYFGFLGEPPASEVVDQLTRLADHWGSERVVPLVLQPLSQAISSRR